MVGSRGSSPTSSSPNVVSYTADAARQVDALHSYFEDKGRIEASQNLDRALDEAEARITRQPETGLPAPRPYPDIAREGEAWTKAGRYWIAYRAGTNGKIFW